MYRVACLDEYDDEVFERIASEVPEGFELVRAASYDSVDQAAAVQDVDFILTGWAPVPSSLFENNPKLKFIQKFGVGYDKIDIQSAGERGIPVAIASGSNAHPVAELTIALMLGVLRHLHYAIAELRQGNFTKSELRAISYQLKGKTVGLIGLGNVGKEVARIAAAFGAHIIYFDVQELEGFEASHLGVVYKPLESVLSEADIVSLHMPLNANTAMFMNHERIGSMKPSAVLINTARGELVDENALAEAIEAGHLLGAGLDVTADEPVDPLSPLLKLSRVMITPHIGGSVVDNVSNVASHCFKNMLLVLEDKPIPEDDLVNHRWLRRS